MPAIVRPELLGVAPPGAEPFVLLAEAAGDQRFVPYVRSHRIWEPAETLAVLRMLRSGMHVVDVGAHVGYYSVLFSRCVGAQGSVLALEPEPRNGRLLRANLLLNECDNVEVCAKAAADAAGRARLHLSVDNLGDHRLQPVAGRAGVDVETVALDDLLAGRAVDFVKIDTQGAEPRVLRGLLRTIERRRAHLATLLEFAPGLLADAGVSVDAFARQLEALDARVYGVALSGRNVTLQRCAPLAPALDARARALAATAEHDASCDLFVCWSDAAEADWLARYRG